MGKCVITAVDVLDAAKAGKKSIAAPTGACIVTAGARDKAVELGIILEEGAGVPPPSEATPSSAPPAGAAEILVREVCDLLKSRVATGTDPRRLESLVREAVSAKIGGAGPDPAVSRASGVFFVSGQRLLDTPAGPVPVAEKALVAEAIRGGENTPMAGGYMEWEKASFGRSVEHPEIGIVIEGELHLTVGGKTLVAKTGDMLYFPKGTQVVYTAPARVRLACVNCLA
ncbi:MAG: cupin domain-containing protein [Desulfobacterales bacterium]